MCECQKQIAALERRISALEGRATHIRAPDRYVEKRDVFERCAAQVEQLTGLRLQSIVAQDRRAGTVMSRNMLIRLCRDGGMTIPDISRAVDRDTSTVQAVLAGAEKRLKGRAEK